MSDHLKYLIAKQKQAKADYDKMFKYGNILIFEAEDINDPKWDIVINVLREHIPGFKVRYGDGNNMMFVIPHEDTPE